MSRGGLTDAGRTLRPLTPLLRHGIIAITVLALVSFLISITLFFYLSYKFVAWRLLLRQRFRKRLDTEEVTARDRAGPAASLKLQRRQTPQQVSDFNLGIDGIFHDAPQTACKAWQLRRKEGDDDDDDDDDDNDGARERLRPSCDGTCEPVAPNQFLVLVYNLLLADIHQSLAFLLNASWLRNNGIFVNTPTCFVQGLFMSAGDLASSMFITLIAIHTYMSVIRGRRPTMRVLYSLILATWFFVYAVTVVPIFVTRNGAYYGGYYVRAGAWCWINISYRGLRFGTHYFFIFFALAVTSAVYVAIFLALRRSSHARPGRSGTGKDRRAAVIASHQPAFLVYPLIYVACTLPLALGRIATMADKHVPNEYYCFAGAIIAFNGTFDCLLFGITRKSIIFGSASNVGAGDTGLRTFNFQQTPSDRRYGNMVWIEGGSSSGDAASRAAVQPRSSSRRRWWGWARPRHEPSKDPWARHAGARNTSQDSLRGAAIQMDMVTSVVVETQSEKGQETVAGSPRTMPSAGASPRSVLLPSP